MDRIITQGDVDRVAARDVDGAGGVISSGAIIRDEVGADRVAAIDIDLVRRARRNSVESERSAARSQGRGSSRVVLQHERHAVCSEAAAGLVDERRRKAGRADGKRLRRIEKRAAGFVVVAVGQSQNVVRDWRGRNASAIDRPAGAVASEVRDGNQIAGRQDSQSAAIQGHRSAPERAGRGGDEGSCVNSSAAAVGIYAAESQRAAQVLFERQGAAPVPSCRTPA